MLLASRLGVCLVMATCIIRCIECRRRFVQHDGTMRASMEQEVLTPIGPWGVTPCTRCGGLYAVYDVDRI